MADKRHLPLFEEDGLSWQDHARCKGIRDPDIFFPERGEPTKRAKEVCDLCIVKRACLRYALLNREKYGIWGGQSEIGRRRIRKQSSLMLIITGDDDAREVSESSNGSCASSIGGSR